MCFKIESKDYLDYISEAMIRLEVKRDLVTELDSQLGDGDHMVNLSGGLEKVLEEKEVLSELSFSNMLKRIGMILLQGVGGSSGLLYGSAYIQASKIMLNEENLNEGNFQRFVTSLNDEIMKRGQVKPGEKTMLDSLNEAIETYKSCESGTEVERMLAFKAGAIQGMLNTESMAAQKGRGRYHATKGMGIIDAGAMTMAIQLECLADIIIEKIESEVV